MMSQSWSRGAGGRTASASRRPTCPSRCRPDLTVTCRHRAGLQNPQHPQPPPRLGKPLSYWLLFLGQLLLLFNTLSLGLICKLRIAILTFFNLSIQLVGPQFPDQGSNPCPRQAKCLTTGPLGNSLFPDQILMALHPGHTSLLSLPNTTGHEEDSLRSLPGLSPAFTVNPNPLADWDFPSLPPYG